MSDKSYLNDVTGDMPNVSPMAATIAEKVQNEKQEENPSPVPEGPKKRGRKPGQKNKPPAAGNSNGSRLGGVASKAERDLLAQDAERAAAAHFITEMVEISGVAIAGDDGRMHPTEKMALAGSWEKYLLSKGINDIPPGIAITLVMSQYYIRVFASPPAQPKVKVIFGWVKNKIKGIGYARFMRRNDGKRKNDTRETTDTGVPDEGD